MYCFFVFAFLHIFQSFPCTLGEKRKNVSFSRVCACVKAKIPLVSVFPPVLHLSLNEWMIGIRVLTILGCLIYQTNLTISSNYMLILLILFIIDSLYFDQIHISVNFIFLSTVDENIYVEIFVKLSLFQLLIFLSIALDSLSTFNIYVKCWYFINSFVKITTGCSSKL